MDVGRHAAARVDPGLDVQHLAAVGVGAAREAVALPQRRILDPLFNHRSFS
jgi:hypothetical protein